MLPFLFVIFMIINLLFCIPIVNENDVNSKKNKFGLPGSSHNRIEICGFLLYIYKTINILPV